MTHPVRYSPDVERQPLGSVNRSRRETYEMSANFRGTFNGCPVHDLAVLPAQQVHDEAKRRIG